MQRRDSRLNLAEQNRKTERKRRAYNKASKNGTRRVSNLCVVTTKELG